MSQWPSAFFFSALTVTIYHREPGKKWMRSLIGLSNGFMLGGLFPAGFILGSGREDLQVLLAILFIIVGLIGMVFVVCNYRYNKRCGNTSDRS
jgi:4-hydroxybenzoate polyprenyltransferase